MSCHTENSGKFDCLVIGKESFGHLFHNNRILILKLLTFSYIFFGFINGLFLSFSKYPFTFWLCNFITTALLPTSLIIIVSKIPEWRKVGWEWPKGSECIINYIAGVIGISLLIPFFLFALNNIFVSFNGQQFAKYLNNMDIAINNFIFSKHILIIYSSITAGIFEELVYKGYLFKIISEKVKSIPICFLLTSIIFGIVHWEQGIAGILIAFCFSFGSILIYYKIQNLLPFMIGHFFANVLMYIL